jgi:hypothetical protein
MRLLEKDPAKRPADGFVILRSLERIRGKLERKARAAALAAEASTVEQPTLTARGEELAIGRGPATLVAGIVRRELTEQNLGGPVARFFNHPITLLLMLAACIALIVYGLTRKKPTAEELFAGAQPLMTSDRPSDWERAWSDYLEPLNERFPNHPHRDEIAAFRRAMLDWREQERVLRGDQSASEAERLYRQGLAHAQAGDPAAARRVWRGLATVFQGSEADRRWVDLAERGLKRLGEPAYSPAAAIEAALARAQKLRDAGKPEEADAILAALEELYRNDPDAAARLEQIRAQRRKPE